MREPDAPRPQPAERRLPTIRGRRVVLRPLRAADRDALRAILAEPDVARWWGTGSAEREVGALYQPGEEARFAIELDGTLVGAIQYAEENEPDYRHAAIDVFVGSAHQNRGLGTDAVRALARHLFVDRGHHRLTIDPAASNARAIRAYAKVGFRPVGIMHAYERGRDGSWHDGLLMDMLADELADDP